MDGTFRLPGFVDAHCHAFQRALRGRGGGGDFWAWRDSMLGEAERQSPMSVREEYPKVYRELLAAGYTAVGEFHYLGFDEALAAADAAEEAGIAFVLLLAAYGRGGLPRFRQESAAEYLRQLEELRGRGIAVLLNSHLLSEIELVCDRVAILLHGKLVEEGSPAELARPRGVEIETDEGTRLFEGAGRDDTPQLVAELVASGRRVYGVRVLTSTLEDTYLEAVGGETS